MTPWRRCSQPYCAQPAAPGRNGRCLEHDRARRRFAETRRASPAERGYGYEWRKLRAAILERDGGICTVPGCGQPARTVDHLIPKSQGGSDDPSNLAAKCSYHQNQKAGRERWL